MLFFCKIDREKVLKFKDKIKIAMIQKGLRITENGKKKVISSIDWNE